MREAIGSSRDHQGIINDHQGIIKGSSAVLTEILCNREEIREIRKEIMEIREEIREILCAPEALRAARRARAPAVTSSPDEGGHQYAISMQSACKLGRRQ